MVTPREKKGIIMTRPPPLPSAKFLLQEGVLWKDSLIKLDGCSFFGSCSRTEGAYRIFGRCNPKFINWNVLCSKMNLYEFHLFGENFRRFFFSIFFGCSEDRANEYRVSRRCDRRKPQGLANFFFQNEQIFQVF